MMAHNSRLELSSEKLRHQFEGQLSKYTNVVKGWQYRWFVLNPESGTLNYYLNESEKKQRPRGSVHLAAAVISPSDEDSNTFTVNSASGELFKLRATDARSRQEWVNRIRAAAEMHTMAIAQSNPPLPPREHISLVHAPTPAPQPHYSLELIDAFASVREHILRAERSCQFMSREIEELPSSGSLKHNDDLLLLLKATSQAAVGCLYECLLILEQQQVTATLAPNVSKKPPHFPRVGSSQFVSYVENNVKKTTASAAASPVARRATASTSNTSLESTGSRSATTSVSSVPDSGLSRQTSNFTSYLETSTDKEILPALPVWSMSLSSPSPPPSPPASPVAENKPRGYCSWSGEVTDTEEFIEEDELESDKNARLIIRQLSKLKHGEDFSQIQLPEWTMEKRSLLELFADSLRHCDIFVRIPDAESPQARMVAVLEWYLACFYMARKGSTTKKPYSPIKGEYFRCSWRIPTPNDENKLQKSTSSDVMISYIAEQISHHPSLTGFYVECPSKMMFLTGHIKVKPNLTSMSVGANMTGEINLCLGSNKEKYTFTLPAVYARSVLSDPWLELCGRVSITASTGYIANVTFHTKEEEHRKPEKQIMHESSSQLPQPVYGGKANTLTGEIKDDKGITVCQIQGDWSDCIEFVYAGGEENKVVDLNHLTVYKKRVRPLENQGRMESRKLWQDVTRALKCKNFTDAGIYKREIEKIQQQQEEEIRRTGCGDEIPHTFFHLEGKSWAYNNMLFQL